MKQKEKETLEKAILKGEIRGKIDASEILNEPPDICSWTYKWGVVLTRDQAKLFLSLLSSTMRTEEEVRDEMAKTEALLETDDMKLEEEPIESYIGALKWVLNEGESEKGEKS